MTQNFYSWEDAINKINFRTSSKDDVNITPFITFITFTTRTYALIIFFSGFIRALIFLQSSKIFKNQQLPDQIKKNPILSYKTDIQKILYVNFNQIYLTINIVFIILKIANIILIEHIKPLFFHSCKKHGSKYGKENYYQICLQ